jgi:tape measure domain-containing protein
MAKNYIEFELRPNVAIGEFTRKFNALEGEAQRAFLDASTVQPKPVTQKVTLQAELNETGFKSAVALTDGIKKNSEQLSTFINQANKLQDGSVAKLKQQLAQATQVRNEIARYETSIGGVAAIVRSVNPLWTEQNNRVKLLREELNKASASSFWDRLKVDLNFGAFEKFGGVVNGLVNTFQSLGIIFGQIIAPINDVIDTLGKLQGIDLTFRAIGQGPADVATIFQASTDIATKYGVSLNAVREGFVKLSPTVLAAGGNLGQVEGVVSALSSRFAAFGLSADQANRVLNGIIQAFGKGKLQAEELNQQISEADPAFRVDFAEALQKAGKELGILGGKADGTVANLNELVKNGEITADVLLAVLPYTEKLSSAFGALGPTAQSALQAFAKGQATVKQVTTQIQNLNQLNFETLAKSVQPLIQSFIQLQAIATDTFAVFLKSEAFKLLSTVLSDLVGGIVFIVTALVKLGTAFAAILDPVLGALNAINSVIPVTKLLGVALGVFLAGSVIKLATSAIPLLIGSTRALIAANQAWLASTLASSAPIGKLASTIKSNVIPSLLAFGANLKGKTLSGLASLIVSTKTATTALDRIKGVTGAAGGSFGILAPTISALASRFTSTAASSKAAGKAIQTTGATAANAAGDLLGTAAATAAGEIAADLAAKSFGKYQAASKAAGGAAKAASGSFKITGDVLEGVNAGTAAAGINWGKFLAVLRVTALPVAVAATAFAALNTATNTSSAAAKSFEEAFKSIKTELQNTKATLKSATSEFQSFINVVNQIRREQGAKIPQFLEGLDVSRASEGLQKGKAEIEETFADLTKEIDKYDRATASDRSTENIKAGVKAKIQSYDALIQANIAARNEFAKKWKDSGASPQNIAALKKYAAEIEQLRRDRQKFVNEAAAKGITFNAEVSTEEFNGSIEFLKAEIKSLGEDSASIKIGLNEPYRQKLNQEIIGIKQVLQLLENDPVLIKAEVQFKAQISELKAAVDLGKAYADKIKASLDLDQSTFTLAKANVDYKISGAERELEALKDRNASESEIKAKELEIKDLKEQQAGIEKEASIAKLNGLAATQKAERQSLEQTQRMRQLELEIAIIRARADQNAAKAALTRYEQKRKEAQIDAFKDGKVTDEELERINYFDELVNLSKQNVSLRNQEVAALEKSKKSVQEQNQVEKDTLGIRQQTEVNTAQAAVNSQNITASATAAARATLGIATAAKQVSYGLIQAGGKVIELTSAASGTNSAFAQVGRSAAAAGGQISAGLDGAASSVESIATAAKEATGQIVTSVQELGNVGGQAADNLQGIASPLQGLKGSFDEVTTAANNIATPIEGAQDSISPLNDATGTLATNFGGAAEAASGLSSSVSGVATSAASAGVNSRELPENLGEAETKAQSISDKLNSLDGTRISVEVSYSGGLPGFWTGGPVNAGKLIRVNELGKESFLSNSGKLSMINKPRNATFRPPTSGTIIPAHITKMMNIPRSGVKVSRNASSKISRTSTGNSSIAAMTRAIAGALNEIKQPSNIKQDYGQAEAAQAAQLGRLHNAINRLSEKNWNVNVNLRNTGSTGYLDALNRSL